MYYDVIGIGGKSGRQMMPLYVVVRALVSRCAVVPEHNTAWLLWAAGRVLVREEGACLPGSCFVCSAPYVHRNFGIDDSGGTSPVSDVILMSPSHWRMGAAVFEYLIRQLWRATFRRAICFRRAGDGPQELVQGSRYY